MKSNHSFSSYVSLFSRLALSLALLNSMSPANAGEVVKSTDKTPRAETPKKEDLPTPEEIKMGAVKSPYKACEGVVTVERSERPSTGRGGPRTAVQIAWDEKAEFWKNYPGKGCDAAKVNCTRKVQFIPDTHFYKTFDGRANRDNFTSKESASDFLKRVAEKSIAKTQARIDEFKKQKDCLEAGTGDCMKGYLERMAVLKAKLPEFRLAVARANDLSGQELNKGNGSVSKKGEALVLRDFSTAKDRMIIPDKMPALSKEERAILIKEMDSFFATVLPERKIELEKQVKAKNFATPYEESEYRSQLFAPNQSDLWLKPKFESMKEKAVLSYTALLAAYPELGYVNEADLDAKKMPAKLALAIKDAEKTKEGMAAAKDAESRTPGAVSDKRMGFAAHTRTIEEMLAQEGDGRSCAVANAVLNELGTVRTKEGAIIGGLTGGLSIGLGVWGALVGRGASAALVSVLGSSAGAVGNTLGALAFATGLTGGFYQTNEELNVANDTIRDAKVGIVKVEDSMKAFDNKAITTALGVLNLQGGSVWLGAAAGAGIGAAGATNKILLSRLLKNGAKGGGGGAAAKEADALAANIIKANAGDPTAQNAVLATAAAQEKAVFGRAVAADDRPALDAITATGVAGTPENPNPETLKVVANNLAGLQGDNKAKAAYVANVKELADSARLSSAGDKFPGRKTAIANAIPEMADVIPLTAAKQILADPAWDNNAIAGVAAVTAEIRKVKGTPEERFSKAWETVRVRVGLAKEKADDILNRCRCIKFCPMPTVAKNGEPLETTESLYTVCAAPLPAGM